jgi:hypothetical protein
LQSAEKRKNHEGAIDEHRRSQKNRDMPSGFALPMRCRLCLHQDAGSTLLMPVKREVGGKGRHGIGKA